MRHYPLLLAPAIYLSLTFIVHAVSFDYIFNGTNQPLQVTFTSGGSGGWTPLWCPAEGLIDIGFLPCNSSGNDSKMSSPMSFDCPSGSRIKTEWIDQYVNAHGGVGQQFTISSPDNLGWGGGSVEKAGLCLSIRDGVHTMQEIDILAFGNLIPTSITCSIGEPINLNHGTLSGDEVNGNKTSKNVSITCDGATTAKITAGSALNSTEGTISMNNDGSLISNIKVNGNQTGGQGVSVNLNKGANTISVDSILQSTNSSISSGSYTGVGVLVVSPE